MAGTGSMPKVMGRARARATVKVRPGIEPKISPTNAPRPIEAMAAGVRTSESASRKRSMFLSEVEPSAVGQVDSQNFLEEHPAADGQAQRHAKQLDRRAFSQADRHG